MGLWTKLFGGPSVNTAPEASWHVSKSDCIREVIRDVQRNQPERVLIVGPVGALTFSLEEAARTERLAHRLLINKEASLTWLGDAVRTVRETKVPSIILSPYPRRARPPTINIIESVSFQAPVQRTIVLEDVSLALRASDDKVSVGVYLIGLYTSGYWKSVHDSQDGLLRKIERFQMLSSKDCGAFIDAESDVIDATAPAQRQDRLLKLSETWESDPESSILAFEGPVLTP